MTAAIRQGGVHIIDGDADIRDRVLYVTALIDRPLQRVRRPCEKVPRSVGADEVTAARSTRSGRSWWSWGPWNSWWTHRALHAGRALRSRWPDAGTAGKLRCRVPRFDSQRRG